MNFVEFLSPIFRRSRALFVLFVILGIVLWGLTSLLVPPMHKTTVFFTVKPVASTSVQANAVALDPVESASKVAEMIAGWAQNPAFREQILQEAKVPVDHFKRKLSARRQNRLNVFWTLKLSADEAAGSVQLTDALIKVFQKNFTDFNARNSMPFEISAPLVFQEMWTFPLIWKIVAVVFLALFLSIFGIYFFEAVTNRVSFLSEVWEIFPESPLLRVGKKIGSHNPKLLEQFILTFDSPRLIATFKGADPFFQLAPIDTIDEERDVPVLLVRLGETRSRDLENFLALFGDEIGIVVFEK